MQRLPMVLRTCGIAIVLAVAVLAFAPPADAQVRVSIGIGMPVYPAPVVVAPPPVVYRGPRVFAGGYYGYPHRPWRYHRHRW